MGRSKARLLALAGSVALVGGLLAPAAATAAPPPPAAPATHAVPRAAALDVWNDWNAAANSAFDVGSFIWRCLSGVGTADPCGTEDPRQAVFDKLDALDRKIDAHFDQVNQRLNGLEKLSTEIKIGPAQTDLATIQNAGNAAWDKYKALQACATAVEKNGAKECTVGTQTRDAAQALEELRADFVSKVADGKTSVGLSKLQAIFGGVAGTSSNGFAHDLWRLYRLKQNQAAGAADKNASSFHVGVITYETAKDFKQDLKVYGEILGRWGAVLVLSAGLTKEGTAADRKVKGELKLADVNKQLLDRKASGSAAYVINAYWIPELAEGQMIALDKAGQAVKVGNASGVAAGWKAMSTGDLIGISTSLSKSVDLAKVQTAFPKSFPTGGYLVDVRAYYKTVVGCFTSWTWLSCNPHTEYDEKKNSPKEWLLTAYVGTPTGTCRNAAKLGSSPWPKNYITGTYTDGSSVWIGDTVATAIKEAPGGFSNTLTIRDAWLQSTGSGAIDFTYKDLPPAPGQTSARKFGYGAVLECKTTSTVAQYKVIPAPIMLKK